MPLPNLKLAQKIHTTNQNIFIIGKAGSGKTTILRLLTNDNALLLAPFESSAIVLGGITIESFLKSKQYVKKIQNIQNIIIDDITTISMNIFDSICKKIQKLKMNNEEFGGIKLIIAGDLTQHLFLFKENALDYEYFFESEIFKSMKFSIIRLNDNHRCKDNNLISIINKIPFYGISREDLKFLNKNLHLISEQDINNSTIITNTIKKSDMINDKFLFKLNGKMHCSRAITTSKFGWNPNRKDLRFKIGASVSMLEIPKFTKYLPNEIFKIKSIQILDNQTFILNIAHENKNIEIQNFTWNHLEETFIQLPIRLIHSLSVSQCVGKTLGKSILNPYHYQSALYMLLSRFKHIDDLLITHPFEIEHFTYNYKLKNFIENYDGSIKTQNNKIPIKLAIFSDLHLECCDIFEACINKADILILAGDISVLDSKYYYNIEKIFQMWKHKPIVYIFGNHEYYTNKTMAIAEKEFRIWAMQAHKNLYILQNESINILGVEIFGGTMWTDFASQNDNAMTLAQKKLGDFQIIQFKENRTLKPIDTVIMHKEFCDKLKQWGEKNENLKSKIVVTHHCPINLSSDNKFDSSAFYANDIMQYIKAYKPLFWIYGHTHKNIDTKIDETMLVCNQRGYPKQDKAYTCNNFCKNGKIIDVNV